MTHIEKNKLFAEFIGSKIGKGGTNRNPVYTNCIIHPMKTGWTTDLKSTRYHESWDWLMPVIDKIRNIYFAESDMKIIDCRINHLNIWADIRTIYDEAFKFITWYNENKKFI